MSRRVVLFGRAASFHYQRIGGTDSFLRRLIDAAADRPDLTVDGVFYDSEQTEVLRPHADTTLQYVTDLDAGLSALSDVDGADVVTTRLSPRDRLTFARYRRANPSNTYHSFEFFYPESAPVRTVKFAQYRLLPYDGAVFCVSRRLHRAVRRFTERARYLPPPVDEGYFHTSDEKPDGETISLTFVGRVDPRKGVEEVVDLYRALADESRFDFAIHGTYIADDEPAVRLRNELRDDPDIDYNEVDRHDHSPAVDEEVQALLAGTDVFLQPYRTLDSTVDTPLLLLESMASLCAVLTRPVGNVGDVYGDSEFLLADGDVTAQARRLLSSLDRDAIRTERDRLADRVTDAVVETPAVLDAFERGLRAHGE